MDIKNIIGFILFLNAMVVFGQNEILKTVGSDQPSLNYKNQTLLMLDATYGKEFSFSSAISYSPIKHLGVMLNSNVDLSRKNISVGGIIGTYFHVAYDTLQNRGILLDVYVGLSKSFLDLIYINVESNIFSFQTSLHFKTNEKTTISFTGKLNAVDVRTIDLYDLDQSQLILNEIVIYEPMIVPSSRIRISTIHNGFGAYFQLAKFFYNETILIENGLSATIGMSLDLGMIFKQRIKRNTENLFSYK